MIVATRDVDVEARVAPVGAVLVADGTFVAWWPSQHGVRTAVASDDDGTELATVTPRAGQTGLVTP